jgi:hypothetical protein
MPAVPAVLSGGRHQDPQLPKPPVGPEPVQTPAKKGALDTWRWPPRPWRRC